MYIKKILFHVIIAWLCYHGNTNTSDVNPQNVDPRWKKQCDYWTTQEEKTRKKIINNMKHELAKIITSLHYNRESTKKDNNTKRRRTDLEKQTKQDYRDYKEGYK